MAKTDRAAPKYAAAALFTGLAAYMLASPALPQIFGVGAPFVRQWTMFSGVGVGLPKGTFTLEHEDGTQEALTPLAAAGLDRYPIRRPIYRFDGYATDPDKLPHYAAATCTALQPGTRLSFDGAIAEKHHWYRVEKMTVCEAAS